MSIVEGIVKTNGTSVVGAGGVWTTTVTLTHWRIDGGEVQAGELTLSEQGVDDARARVFHARLPAEHIVRLEASLAEETQRWQFTSVEVTDTSSDPELLALIQQLRQTSAATDPSHVVTLAQTASIDDLGSGGFEALREQVAQRVAPPWSGPDPKNRFIKLDRTDGPLDLGFGMNPAVSVIIRPSGEGASAACTLRQDLATGNTVLAQFLQDIGGPAAAALGSRFTTTMDTFLVPDSKRVEGFDLPGVGVFAPAYDVYIGTDPPTVSVESFLSAPRAVPMFDDMSMRFAIWDGPLEERAAELAAEAVSNFCGAGSEVRDETARYVFEYYQSVRSEFSDEDCVEYGIPLDVTQDNIWEHVRFTNPPNVSPQVGEYKGLVHPDVAYIDFECGCSWEEEHGLNLVFVHGERVGKVGPVDGHLTNATAFADPALLDVVFRS